jgi:hypothetical protein
MHYMHKTDIQDYTFCVHTVSMHCPNTFIYATGRHLREFFYELYWNLVEIRYFRVLFTAARCFTVQSVNSIYSYKWMLLLCVSGRVYAHW